MVRHCQYNAADLLWRTDISGSCWITKPSSPWEADWSPTFANLCHLWHLHLYLATYVSGRTQPPPTFVFSTEPTRDWQMVKSESLMPTIPRYHPPPPHIGPVSWKNPIFKRDCARGSAPTELIQLFLKFCRYSCGGIDIGSGIYWDRSKQKFFRQLDSHFKSYWSYIQVIIT